MADKPPVPKGEKGHQAGDSFWGARDDVEDADALVWPESVRTFDRMRRQDPQVGQSIQALTMPILRTPWRIDPNGARDEVVKHIADDLGLPIVGMPNRTIARTANRFQFGEHLRLALTSRVFGFAFFEQVYEVRRDGPNGTPRVHLKKLAWRPPRTISSVDVADDGGLVAIHQNPTPGVVIGPNRDIEIGVERLVAYVNNREGGNWLGQSVLRPAFKSWVLKDRLLRVQAQSIDRNGMGFPVYTASEVPAAVTDAQEITDRIQADIDAGFEIATGVRSGENAGASIAPGAKLQLLGVEGTLPNADPAIRLHNEEITKAIIGNNLLNLGGENSTGSYALGDTFEEFLTLSLQGHAIDVQDTFNRHVIEDLVDYQYGTDEPAPRLVFDEIGTKHQVTAQAIYQLVQVGAIRMDDRLEEYLRTTYQLPPIDVETLRTAPVSRPSTNAPVEDPVGGTDPAPGARERRTFAPRGGTS